MPSPTPSLNLVRLYGKFDNPASTGPALMGGKYTVSLPVDLESATDDAIILSGIYETGDLKTTGPYSFDVMVPANDDPDITSLVSWRVVIDFKFSDGRTRHYEIDTPYANRPTADGGNNAGVNLRGKPYTGSPAVAQIAALKLGEPGGVALINSAGQVLDGAGNPVTIGGSVAAASTTTAGIAPFATTAKADTGTDTASAMTPALVKRRVDIAQAAAVAASQPRSLAAPVVAAAGTTQTLSPAYDTFNLTLTAASCAITLPAAPGYPSGVLVALRQDATGGRAVTWVAPGGGAISWTAGTAPTLNPAAGTTTIVSLYSLDGTANWTGVADATSGTTTTTTGTTRPATMPDTFTYTTCDRRASKLSNTAMLTSGTLYLAGIDLPAGASVKRIGFYAGSTAAGLTNQWFALYDKNLNKLAVTLDDGAATWNAGILKMLTISNAVTISTAGLYYLGICVVGTTPPQLATLTGLTYINASPPILAGNSTTGLTNPASAPATAILGAQPNLPYGGVSAT